jgi:hypothetical protein
MSHLQAKPGAGPEHDPYAEAVSRLAGIRHALKLVDDHGGGPASDPAGDERIAANWDKAGEGRRRLFDRRSSETVCATAAGVQALLDERAHGREPHSEASRTLVEQIRRELEEMSLIVLR